MYNLGDDPSARATFKKCWSRYVDLSYGRQSPDSDDDETRMRSEYQKLKGIKATIGKDGQGRLVAKGFDKLK